MFEGITSQITIKACLGCRGHPDMGRHKHQVHTHTHAHAHTQKHMLGFKLAFPDSGEKKKKKHADEGIHHCIIIVLGFFYFRLTIVQVHLSEWWMLITPKAQLTHNMVDLQPKRNLTLDINGHGMHRPQVTTSKILAHLPPFSTGREIFSFHSIMTIPGALPKAILNVCWVFCGLNSFSLGQDSWSKTHR